MNREGIKKYSKPILSAIVLSLLLLVVYITRQQPHVPANKSLETNFKSSSKVKDQSDSDKIHLQSSEDGLDIVFSGGGAKSIAQIGALKELEEQDISYRRVVGTSSGSIMALFVAAGYSADEMAEAITQRTPDGQIILASFMDVPESFEEESINESLLSALFTHTLDYFLPNIIAERLDESAMNILLKHPSLRETFSFIEFGGVYEGEVFLSWLKEKLDSNDLNLAEATLAEFHEQTGNDLTAIVTDVTDHEMLIVNHRTAPDLPVAWLIRMSMSIPFVYNHVSWQPEWGLYQGVDINGHDIVDGGVGSNFGIEMVVSHEPEFVNAMGMEPDPKRVIGLFLDDTMSADGTETNTLIENEAPLDDPLHTRWLSVKQRNQALLTTFLKSHDHFVVRTHPDKVCHLPVKGFDTMEFDMSEERIQALLDSGQQAMRKCLLDMAEEGR